MTPACQGELHRSAVLVRTRLAHLFALRRPR